MKKAILIVVMVVLVFSVYGSGLYGYYDKYDIKGPQNSYRITDDWTVSANTEYAFPDGRKGYYYYESNLFVRGEVKIVEMGDAMINTMQRNYDYVDSIEKDSRYKSTGYTLRCADGHIRIYRYSNSDSSTAWKSAVSIIGVVSKGGKDYRIEANIINPQEISENGYAHIMISHCLTAIGIWNDIVYLEGIETIICRYLF